MSLDVSTLAQTLSALSIIPVYAVFAYLYWRLVKLQRHTIDETREQRVSGGRPQVIVEADYQRFPEIDFVVRNVGGGPAKEITFDFSANVKSSTGFVLTDLLYLRDGMDFLGPGGEIRCLWDDIGSLEGQLLEDGLDRGMRVEVRYEGMGGDTYHSDYVVNPLLYKGIRNANRSDMNDLVQLLQERMPGGPVGGKHPESSEEYERRDQGDPRGADEPTTSSPAGVGQSVLNGGAGKNHPKEDPREGDAS